jgi:hypothetical protein
VVYGIDMADNTIAHEIIRGLWFVQNIRPMDLSIFIYCFFSVSLQKTKNPQSMKYLAGLNII